MRSMGRRLRAAFTLATSAGLLWAAPAMASTYVVNSNADFSDAIPGNDICGVGSSCSLRAGIEESNAHPGPDTVQLSAENYAMGGAEPSVDTAVTILGAGRFLTTISRGAPGRVLAVGPGGRLDLRDVKVTGGVLAGQGAGIQSAGELTLRGSSVTGNDAVDGSGGGILIASTAGATLIEDSRVSLNEAGNPGLPTSQVGGGIWQASGAGKLTIRQSTIAANRVDGQAADGGGIYAQGDLEVSDSTIEENTAKADSTAGSTNATGSAIVASGESTILRTEIIDNIADEANDANATTALFFAGPTTITDSIVAGNEEAVTTPSNQLMLINGAGPLTIRGTTFSDNYGELATLVPTTIENSTFSGGAGGLLRVSGDPMTVRATTIADSAGAGLAAEDFAGVAAVVTITGSILAGNAFNCSAPGASAITSAGGNVLDDVNANCGFGSNDLVNTDPMLAPLADNGGFAETRALPAGSPAVDNFAAGCPPPATDQRGRPRPQGGVCDSGAYELEMPAIVTIESGPSGTTADPRPVFTFSANEPVSGAECRLLGVSSAFAPCSSPATFGPLANGEYTFEVRVIDSDGNPSPAASRSFTVSAAGSGDTEVDDPDVTLAKKLSVKGKELKVKVSAGAQEDVSLLAKGTVVVKPRKKDKGKTRTVGLKPVKKSAEGGERTILRLKYRGGKKTRQRLTRKLVRQIKQGKRARVRVQVVFTDGADNRASEKRVSRLKVKRRRS